MSRNACENKRNGNDFHSGHRKQNSYFPSYSAMHHSEFALSGYFLMYDVAVYSQAVMHALVSKLPRMPSVFPVHGSCSTSNFIFLILCCNLNLISFNSDNTTFVISIACRPRSTYNLIPITFHFIC